MEWRHVNSPSKKKLKTLPSAGKVMCSVFRDRKGVILLDFLEPGQTMNSDRYIMMLTKLKARISRVRPEKKTTFLLQHNARSHTSLKTVEHIANLGWTVLPHPPYSPDLAPSDFHMFGPMKDGLHGQHFPSNDPHRMSCETVGHLCWCRFLRVWHAGSCSSLAKVHSQWWWLCRKIVFCS